MTTSLPQKNKLGLQIARKFTLVPLDLNLVLGTWDQPCVHREREEAEIMRLRKSPFSTADHSLKKKQALGEAAVAEATGRQFCL